MGSWAMVQLMLTSGDHHDVPNVSEVTVKEVTGPGGKVRVTFWRDGEEISFFELTRAEIANLIFQM